MSMIHARLQARGLDGTRSLLWVTGLFAVAVTVACTVLDENPRVAPAEIAGHWQLDREELILHGAGRFDLTGERSDHGSWRLHDWNLSLAFDSGRSELWRVIELNGELRLARSWETATNPSSARYFTKTGS